MVCCYVVGCKSGNNGSRCHTFKISRKATEETKKKWLYNIPKQKLKQWNFKTCVLCHLHFEEKYIVKVNQVTLNGHVMASEQRKQWKLTEDAVPTIFANDKLPSYCDKPVKERKPPFFRKPFQPINGNMPKERRIPPEEKIFHEPHTAKTFTESVLPFLLPECWLLIKLDEKIQFQKIVQNTNGDHDVCKIEKAMEVYPDLSIKFYIRGREVTTDCTSIKTIDDIEETLKMFDCIVVCAGIQNFNAVIDCAGGRKFGRLWFSTNCAAIYSDGICPSCLPLKSSLQLVAKKLFAKPKPRKLRKPKKPYAMSNASRTIQRLTHRVQTMTQELRYLRLEVRKLNTTRLTELIETEPNLPKPMKSALIASARVAKNKSKYGNRYASDWLLQCLLIRITSPKTYRFLRNNKILALPHPNHLSKLLRGVPCEFGFNDFVFTELQKQYQEKDQCNRQFMMSFDEIKVRESIQFDKIAGRFTGFIDYGEFTDEYWNSTKNKILEADHALVIMIRNMNSNMVQPIASFASRGAAPGNILAKIVISSIMKLEAVNCEVIGVVSDGAATNKKLWKLLGIDGRPGHVNSSIKNPYDGTRDVYFVSDIPHIYKCVRNHLLAHEIGEFQGGLVNWGFYRAVFEYDRGNDLKLAPKLTKHHLRPGPFQKMIVSYATQILSQTVADAIQLQRDVLCRSDFKYSEGTEHFTRRMNAIFDILNAKLPKEGIRLESAEMKELEEFFELLSSPDNVFASDTTMNSFRVTVNSSILLIKYLCGSLEFDYVLTSKFNQDCLERFFGLLRSFGGDDSHPSVISFGHLFRILSMYAPIKTELNGNIRAREETDLALDGFIHEMKSLGKLVAEKRQEIKFRHECQLREKLTESSRDQEIQPSSDYEFDQEGCVVFYLCGYIASRSKNLTSCLACQNTLKTSSSVLPVKAWTDIKSLGGLTYPSDTLYNIIKCYVEPVISAKLHSLTITSNDFLYEVIKDLPSFDLNEIGCSEQHRDELCVQVVLFYITMRCFFYQKIHNNEDLNSSEERKKKMKEAKLT